MTTLLALLLSIVLVLLLLPSFNFLTGKSFSFHSLLNPVVILAILGLTFFVTLLGGSYPAFYLSGFRPAQVLKGKMSGRGASDSLRKFLVTFQFAVAILLMISTNTIIEQMNLIQKSKLNEQGDQLLSIRYGTVAPNNKYAGFKNAVLVDKDLDQVTIGNHLPRHDYFGGMQFPFAFANWMIRNTNGHRSMATLIFPKLMILSLQPEEILIQRILRIQTQCYSTSALWLNSIRPTQRSSVQRSNKPTQSERVA